MFVLRDLDLFKAIPETRFKGQRGGHSSMFGRSLTLCILSLSIGLLIYFSLDMLMKTNPRIETFNAISTDDLILDNETFPFAFAMRDINGSFYIDENIYTVGAYFSVSKKNITLTLCKPAMFQGIYNPETDSPVYCFSEKQDFEHIGINGQGGLVIDFYKCDRAKNPNCRDETEIDDIVYRSRLRILYHDVIITPNDYEKPIDEINRAWDPSVARTIVKENALFLSKNNFISDNGWLFKNLDTITKISFDDRLQYFEDREIMGNVFNVVYVRTYGQIRYTKRTYDNLQTILPRWNAILLLLMVVGKIVSDSYNKFKTQETLVQDIFFLKQKKLRREKTKSRSPTRTSLGPPSRNGTVKEVPSPFVTPPPTDRESKELLPLPSRNSSPAISHKKIKSTEMRALSGYRLRTVEEPKKSEENKPLKKYSYDYYKSQKMVNSSLSMDGLPPPTRGNSEQKDEADNSQQAAFQLKLNMLEIGVENDVQPSQNSISPERCPDLEAVSPPKRKKIRRQRTNLFHEEGDVSFCAWFASNIRKNEHYKKHLKRESIIQEEFDFQNYAKRFIGIDVLKYLLLSKDQLKVFDNCVKAYVNLKLDALTRESATDNDMFDELRTMFNTKGFPAEIEDDALIRLKEIPDPDETTKKALNLLEVLYERET